jgi:hypothetical protein
MSKKKKQEGEVFASSLTTEELATMICSQLDHLIPKDMMTPAWVRLNSTFIALKHLYPTDKKQ